MVKSTAGFLIYGSWIATEAVVGKMVGIATAQAVGKCWSLLTFSLPILGIATAVTGIRSGAGPTKIAEGLYPILQILLAGHLAVPQGSGSCSQAVGHGGRIHSLSVEQQTASALQVGCLQKHTHTHTPICRQKTNKNLLGKIGPSSLVSVSHFLDILFHSFHFS